MKQFYTIILIFITFNLTGLNLLDNDLSRSELGVRPLVVFQSIAISGTCSDSEALGVYEYTGVYNGKASYFKGIAAPACNDINIMSQCNVPKNYTIRWDGSQWEWFVDVNYIDCQWFSGAGLCIPDAGAAPSVVLLATSSNNTPTLPPCNGWVAEPSGCVPAIVGCETLSTTQNVFSNNVTLYPNPTNGAVTINLSETNTAVKVNVVSVTGQLVWTKYYYSASQLQFQIKQPSGMYFVEIIGDKGEKTHLKVLKK